MQLISVRSLAARLSLGFGVILVLLLGMAVLSLLRMQALSATLEDITVHSAARSQTLDVMGRSVSRYVQTLGDLANTDLEGGPAVLAQARSTLAQYDAAQAQLETLLAGDTPALALLAPVKTTGAAARELLALGEQLTAGRGDAAMAFQVRNEYGKDTAQWSARQQAWGNAVDALSDWQDAANATSSALATADARTARVLIIVGALVAFAFGSALAWWLVRDTRAAVREAVEATRRMARHDLSQPIDTHRQDEIGGLLTALEAMRQNLLELATGVRQASDDINNASGEIAQGSQDLSDRTEDAASTLETALASIAQLTASVQETTASAQETQQISTQTSSVAARSGSEMEQVVSTMREIDVASHKISDIISIIDGIAFQTNILALNAAVEAARAGEQGRGFAVVASEVRALAGRSADAAREIKGLIAESVGNVSNGSTQVEKAGSTMDEIVVSVRRVADIMREISEASQDQTVGIAQINQAMQQMDQVTQENAALVEEAAAAAQSLQSQAQALVQTVSVFHTPASSQPQYALGA